MTTQKDVDPCFTLERESIGSYSKAAGADSTVGPVYISAFLIPVEQFMCSGAKKAPIV